MLGMMILTTMVIRNEQNKTRPMRVYDLDLSVFGSRSERKRAYADVKTPSDDGEIDVRGGAATVGSDSVLEGSEIDKISKLPLTVSEKEGVRRGKKARIRGTTDPSAAAGVTVDEILVEADSQKLDNDHIKDL